MPSKKQESDSQFNMDCASNSEQSSQHYCTITYQMRLKLIDLVLNQKYSVLKASKELQIKLSTAKFIVNSYKKKGKVMKRKREIKNQQKLHKQQIQINKDNQQKIKIQEKSQQSEEKSQNITPIEFPVEIMYMNYNPYWFMQYPIGLVSWTTNQTI